MSVSYSVAREYLERSSFPIVALDLILDLPDSEEQEETFFEKFCIFISDRQLSQIINANAIQYYSLFNKLYEMIERILLKIETSAHSDRAGLQASQNKLLKCLVCIYDLIFICEDTSSLKIQKIFPNILEHVSSVEHIINLYAIASILFFCKTASQTDFEMYPKILFHGTPFMKLFDVYGMDIGKIYAETTSPNTQHSINNLTNNYIKVTKHGQDILKYFENAMEVENSHGGSQEPSVLEPQHLLPPKVIAKNIIEKHGLKIEPGSYEYYNLLGEILLGYYIYKNRPEDIISVLTAIQSFCGIFLDFVYQKDEGAKYSVFPTCKLYQEFEPLPHPSIVEVIISYFNKVQGVSEQEKVYCMKKLHNLVRSLSLSLQMESYFANRKRYKPQFTRLLHKFLVPAADTGDFGLWKLVCLGEDLCKRIVRSFATGKEIKHYLIVEKYDPFEFYAEEILEYVLEIVESTMLEITVSDEESTLDVTSIIPEYYYAGRKLNDHFQKKCLEFTWLDQYISVYLWRDYFLCLRAFFSVKENVNEGLVIKIFSKFEELIRLSVEKRFLDCIRNSHESEALIKKHRYLLNLLKGEFRIILAKEDIETSPFNNLFNQIAISNLMEFLLSVKQSDVNDFVGSQIMENCVHAFLFLHTLAQITYPENDKITFYVEDTVKNVSKLTIDYIHDRYKFYELSCFFFQVLKDVELLSKTFELIPLHFEKLLVKVLPDVNIHYNQLAHFFDPLVAHIFIVLDITPHIGQPYAHECINYIKKFLQASKRTIQEIRHEFERYDFSSAAVPVPQPDPSAAAGGVAPALNPHKKLVHESFLCKIKSKMLFFGKIFREVLKNLELIVPHLKDDDLLDICQTVNDIFMNPILLYIEWSCMSRFLDSMKKICNTNETFQTQTVERICTSFVTITDQLEDLISNNPRDSDKILRVKGLINYHRDFWDYYKEHEMNVISSLGQGMLFSIVKLDTLGLFFDFFFEARPKFSESSVTALLDKYDTILDVCIQLEMAFKYDILNGVSETDSSKASDLSSLESMNLYMKVLVLYIFPSLVQPPVDPKDAKRNKTPVSTMEKLCNFVVKNLNLKTLTKDTIKKDPLKLIRQIHTFSLMLAHFPIEHNHKYGYFRVFLSMNKLLGSVLDWIAELLREFEKISDCRWQIISRLENLLSKFMKQLYLVFQVLYQSENISTDALGSVAKIKEKEKEYCEYLCRMIQLDFPYYENFSSKDTLYKIFNNLHHFIETMRKYKDYHTKVKENRNSARKKRRVKGRTPSKEEEDMLKIKSTASQLKDLAFFEEIYELVRASFRKGLKTPCFLIFVLSNDNVQHDLLNLFDEENFGAIGNMLQGLLIKGAKLLKKEKMLIDAEVIESKRVDTDSEVFLNFKFYRNINQKSLRVIEYINVVLAVAVKHCGQFKGQAGSYLDYSHEFGIEILNNFSLANFSNLNGENTLQTLINCYNSLLSRVVLLSIYKVRLNMFKVPKNIRERDKEIISKSFEMVIKQFKLQSEFKKSLLPQGLFLRETYEPYLFLFSVWWLDETYIKRLMEEPDMIMLLLDNANSELSLRFLVSIFTICGVNAFPAHQICEIIIKGLAFSDKTGKLLLNSGRVDVYQEIVGKQMKEVITKSFKIAKSSITLASEDDNFANVTISDLPTKRKGSKPVVRVPTYDYLLSGMNHVTKHTLSSLLEVYLRWFDEEVVAIYEGRDWSKKIFHPIFVLSLLIYKFPELVPYILSYPVALEKYSFPKYFRLNRLPKEMNLFEFIVRVNFYYFPSFIFIHEFVCYNSRQPLAIQFSSQIVLMHELFARFFLEEILKVLKEDLVDNPDNFCNTPESIRKWGIYPTIAFHIFAMCSYKERTYIPLAIFEKYTVFILECVALWRKKKPNGYYELVNPLLRLLQELAHFSLLQGIRVRLQKMEGEMPQREWNWVQDYKKCMKLVKFLGKKSRDLLQNPTSHKSPSKQEEAVNRKKNNQMGDATKMDSEDVQGSQQDIQYEKDIPYLEGNFRDLKTHEIINAPKTLSNYDPNIRKYKWDTFAKLGKLPNEFIHNTGSVNIFAGYLGLFSKIHDNINKFIDNFQNQRDEIKEIKRILNTLHAIDKEYFQLHTSHPKIINFDWKTRFGNEPTNMFNYNLKQQQVSPPKVVDFKKDVSVKLQSHAKIDARKKLIRKPIKKQDLADVVELIKKKGHKIKSRLHNFLEKSILKSLGHYNWSSQSLEDAYKVIEPQDLDAFLKSKQGAERNATFYFMDENTFDKLPPNLREKGKHIKKLIEKELKQVSEHDEDEMNAESDAEEEKIVENGALSISQISREEEKPKDKVHVNSNHVADIEEEKTNKPKKDSEEEELKFEKVKEQDDGVPNGKRIDRAGDYGSDEEEIELVDESRVEDKDGDYMSGDEEAKIKEKKKIDAADGENCESGEEEEKEEAKEEEGEQEDSKEAKGEEEMKDEQDEEEKGELGSEEDLEGEEVEEEAEDLEAGEGEESHDFEGLSFCTNSDISEIFYDEYSDYKASEETVMEKIYSHYFTDHKVFENYYNVIVTLPEISVKDILTFFASEHYYDFRYPTVEINNNVETYYRQLELLMINPENQIKLLMSLTLAINCPPKVTTLPTFTEQNQLNFVMNILQFLHFYARANPQSFFIHQLEHFEKYNYILDTFLEPLLPQAIADIKEQPLISRMLQLFSLKQVEDNELLARKIVNLLCYLARISYERKLKIHLGPEELHQLDLIARSRHCLESVMFRKRAGKLFRYLGKVEEYRDVFDHIEKKIIQDESQELLNLLTDKYDQINEYYRRTSSEGKTLLFEEVNIINNILHCSKLELYCEMLKCMDDHLATNPNSMLIINAIEKMKESGHISKMISIVCQLLILMKKVRELNVADFPMVLLSLEGYIFSLLYMYYLLRQAKNYGDKKLKTLKSLTQKSAVQLEEELELEKFEDQLNNENLLEKLEEVAFYVKDLIGLVFKINLAKISKDSRVLQIMSALNVIPSLGTKEKVMRVYFNQSISEDTQYILPLTIRRGTILSDSLRAFEQHYQKLKKPSTTLKITFAKEAGVDEGGLKKEWLALLINEIFDPKNGLFKLSHNQRCLYPSPQSFFVPKALSLFKIAGIIIGLSIKENIPTGISFTRGFLKLILDQEPNLNDLEELDPDLAKSLLFVLQNSIDGLDTYFTYETELFGEKEIVELKEDGRNILLKDDNKHEYVHLLIQAKLYRDVEVQTKEFKKGLFEIIPESLIKLFLPYELETLICGQSQVDVGDLMQNVQYRDCSKLDKLIVWFWEVVEEFDQEERMSLLFFITGSSSIPYGGFKETKITIIKSNKDVSCLPVAHTCYSELELPNYPSKESLEEKLRFAITEGKEGFHIA